MVDPTPMLDGAAHANEQLAIMMEPTGNTYLAPYNPNKDPAREVQIWEPLVKRSGKRIGEADWLSFPQPHIVGKELDGVRHGRHSI